MEQIQAITDDQQAGLLLDYALGPNTCELLTGSSREQAIYTIKTNHYTKSIPSGKSHYLLYGSAIVVWSIPANKNIAKYILGYHGSVWELSRLWAPDGHDKNLLTQAISRGVKKIVSMENPDALVSYADPNAGHAGGIYRAASWIYHGISEENRVYRSLNGIITSRRAFHSGNKSMKKAEIEGLGFEQLKLPGKIRFVKPITKKAKKSIKETMLLNMDNKKPPEELSK